MHNQPRILIVDDHESIREPLATYVRRFGFEAEAVRDGASMRRRLEKQRFDIIVLDIMLPGEDGLSLCRYATQELGVPVILLSAMTDQADRIAGLEIGADDYVAKPFDPRELVARIRSILRRASPRTGLPDMRMPAMDSDCFAFAGWKFDVTRRELLDRENHSVFISTAEFHLLKAFVENANRVLSRTQLLDLTQKSEVANFDRSIDSQISRLRKKLEPNPRQPNLLKTIRGDGYMFAAKISQYAA